VICSWQSAAMHAAGGCCGQRQCMGLQINRNTGRWRWPGFENTTERCAAIRNGLMDK